MGLLTFGVNITLDGRVVRLRRTTAAKPDAAAFILHRSPGEALTAIRRVLWDPWIIAGAFA